MNSGHSELRRVFLEAVQLPEDDRGAFLDQACGSNLELRNDVQSLLEYHFSETLVANSDGEPTKKVEKNATLSVARKPKTPTLQPLVRVVARALQDHRGAFMSLFVAIALISLLGVWTLYSVRTTLHRSNKDQMHRILAAQARAIDEWIEHRTEQAESWTNSHQLEEVKEKLSTKSELSAEERSQLDRLTMAYAGQRDTAACAVVNLDGRICWSNQAALDGQQLEAPAMNSLSGAYRGKTIFVRPRRIQSSMTSEGEVTPISWIVTPLRNAEHKIVGVIGFGSDANKRFSDLLNVTKMGRSGKSFILNDTGHLLTWRYAAQELEAAGLLDEAMKRSSGGVPLFVGNKSAGDRKLTKLAAAVKEAKTSGQVQGDLLDRGYADFRGQSVYGAWRWLPEYEVALATEVDVREANKPLSIIGFAFTVIIGTLAATVLFGFVIAFQMSRQILDAGQVLGPYTLHEKIGEGGMGKVYLASHALLPRKAAVKILNRAHSAQRDIDRFHREVQLASTLTHPNTVEIYDFGQSDEGIFYCAMEFIDGLTLTQLVKESEHVSPGRARQLLLQVCDSVHEAHELGLMHRDIKPANLLVCKRGGMADVVKVVDFGLAKSIDESQMERSTVTKTSEIVGTPMYMAPERFALDHELDVRSDIYAIGAVGYFLCTGQNVFKDASLPILIKTILNDPPRSHPDNASDELKAMLDLMATCLEKDPNNRPQTVSMLRSQLQELHVDAWTPAQAMEWWDEYTIRQRKE